MLFGNFSVQGIYTKGVVANFLQWAFGPASKITAVQIAIAPNGAGASTHALPAVQVTLNGHTQREGKDLGLLGWFVGINALSHVSDNRAGLLAGFVHSSEVPYIT